MENMKIGTKIYVGFFLVLAFLLAISATSVVAVTSTRSNMDKVDAYNGLQNSANELMHILNETRISAGVLYASHSSVSYQDVTKQLMYCDMRLEKLYEYVDRYPEMETYRAEIEAFEALYSQWRAGVVQLGESFSLEDMREADVEAFAAFSDDAQRINLLAHELLSNTISDMENTANDTMRQTKSNSLVVLVIVMGVSVLSLVAAAILSITIVRSIAAPLAQMRDVLAQIGRTGDLQVEENAQKALRKVASGKDETAQCTEALLVLMERLHIVDGMLAQVAGGDLTGTVALQSPKDTMGLAVQKMIVNLNQKFSMLVQATGQVNRKTDDLSAGSQMLANGAQSQAESVSQLAASVHDVGQKTEQNARLAIQAASLINKIQETAQTGTEKMNQMMQAASDINVSGQSIGKVIKTIDDIAFQTNILALNAAVEAARAGANGKGFAVVADEVRNLATKSAQAAHETSALIEDTIQKAALGTTIAGDTAEALDSIVNGVVESHTVISDISSLSAEQASNIQQIINEMGAVESIVAQNNSIAEQSANAVADISVQTNLLNELVSQFQLQSQAGLLQEHIAERKTL